MRWSVALSSDGNTLAFGGQDETSGLGAVWIYTRSGVVWTPQGDKIVGAGASLGAEMGWSVALSSNGNTFGGPVDTISVGAVWVYTRSGGIWVQQGDKIVGTDTAAVALMGWSVALSSNGNTLAFGSRNDTSGIGAVRVLI